MGKHQWKGPFATVNNLLFFVLYTINRVILFPFIIYSWLLSTQLYPFCESSIIHKLAYNYILIASIGMYLLNLYWYQIIVKGLL